MPHSITPSNPPTEWLGTVSPEARDQYRQIRLTLAATGPLDATTCELINVVGFAILGYEPSFKTHAQRLLDAGMTKAALQQAVVSTLGATTVLYQVALALTWIEDICSGEAGAK